MWRTAALPPEAAPRAETGRGAGRLRIMTWNCHGAIGRDLRCRPERVLAVIQRLQPDILALQEVDGRSHLGRRERAFEWFAEQLGSHIAEARTIRRADRDHGHILWSRWPMRSAQTLTLPGKGLETRMAIEAEIAAPGLTATVLATHMGLSPLARASQARFLAARAAASRHPVVVLGDTNAWRLSGPVGTVLRAVMPTAVTPKSFPAWWPLAAMDRIHAGNGLTLVEAFADRDAAMASDHLPVVADFVFDASR